MSTVDSLDRLAAEAPEEPTATDQAAVARERAIFEAAGATAPRSDAPRIGLLVSDDAELTPAEHGAIRRGECELVSSTAGRMRLVQGRCATEHEQARRDLDEVHTVALAEQSAKAIHRLAQGLSALREERAEPPAGLSRGDALALGAGQIRTHEAHVRRAELVRSRRATRGSRAADASHRVAPARLRSARPRGAGRPRARAVARASSRGGDSGDSGDGEPPPPPGSPLAGPSPRFSRPWRPAVEEQVLDLLGPRP